MSKPQTATILPGTLSTTITIPVIADTRQEPDEDFFVWLINPKHARLGAPAVAHAVIVDDDPRRLTLTATGTGSGTVSASPAGTPCGLNCWAYDRGLPVTLEATAVQSSSFIGWSGDPDCADGTITMDRDKSCLANFSAQPPGTFQLTLRVEGAGSTAVT